MDSMHMECPWISGKLTKDTTDVQGQLTKDFMDVQGQVIIDSINF